MPTLLSLQCCHNVAQGDETLHLLSHHIGNFPCDRVHQHMKKWISLHMDWVKQISAKILTAKHIELEDYIELITTRCQPLDEIGILFIVHMYHMHICVLLKDTY